MKNLLRFISRQISRFIPEEFLFKTNTPFFLPFYHTVSNRKLPYILNYPYRDVNQFEKELDYYLKYFNPVSLEDLLNNRSSVKNAFHLSFDDGLRECTEVIAPILLKKGIPATFFVNAGFVDNKALFHRYKASLILSELNTKQNLKVEGFLKDYGISLKNLLETKISQNEILNKALDLLQLNVPPFLEREKPYLTTNEIWKLKEQGFSVGAHSQNHPEFWQLSEVEKINEIKQSISWVVENFNPTIKAFSFPFTDFGVSAALLKKLKSENICDITFGTAGLKYDEVESHLQRYPAEKGGDFKLNLKAEWIYFKLRKAIGKATVKH